MNRAANAIEITPSISSLKALRSSDVSRVPDAIMSSLSKSASGLTDSTIDVVGRMYRSCPHATSIPSMMARVSGKRTATLIP